MQTDQNPRSYMPFTPHSREPDSYEQVGHCVLQRPLDQPVRIISFDYTLSGIVESPQHISVTIAAPLPLLPDLSIHGGRCKFEFGWKLMCILFCSFKGHSYLDKVEAYPSCGKVDTHSLGSVQCDRVQRSHSMGTQI